MAEIILTSENFEAEVIKSDIPVLVDFWATWCAPCRMLAPTIAEIAEEYEGKIKVGKVNVDEAGDIAAAYRIASIPTVLLFEGGEVKNKSIGFVPKSELTKMFN